MLHIPMGASSKMERSTGSGRRLSMPDLDPKALRELCEKALDAYHSGLTSSVAVARFVDAMLGNNAISSLLDENARLREHIANLETVAADLEAEVEALRGR